MEIGQFIKVRLPGETPWAKVQAITESGVTARIDNELVAELCEFQRAQLGKRFFGNGKPLPVLHNYKYNDVVEFVQNEEAWEPKELMEGEGQK